jgi:predicted DNA-binding transcriptional regulator AlpA
MNLTNLFNEEALTKMINDEVEKLTKIKLEGFKQELSKNYFFDDKLLNRKEVSLKLGISLRQVDTLVKSKKLKKCSIGRSIKFRNSDVLEYIFNLK